MINAGTWLTTTRSSGSGSTIPVYDARYFMDGWGLIEGDVIQFQGQTNTYKVIDVNYSGRSIKIQGSASWAQGVGISLPCKGSRPDMGAFEYDEKHLRLWMVIRIHAGQSSPLIL